MRLPHGVKELQVEDSEHFVVVDPIMNSEFFCKVVFCNIECVEPMAAVSTRDDKL